MERQFTRQAENALKLAKTTAKSCGHGYIGTEHLLAGLLKEPEGTAGKVLQEFNVEEEKLMELISQLIAPAQGDTVVEEKDPQYSPRSKTIIEQAQEDAESMECVCGTEHLLLALLKETDCVATRLLFTMGVNIQKLFAAIPFGKYNDFIVDDEATIVMEYDNGKTGTFILSTGEACHEERLEIIGTKARILLEDDTLTITRHSDVCEYIKNEEVNSRQNMTFAEETIQFEKASEPYAQLFENFANAVLKGDESYLTVKGSEGINSLMLCASAYYSACKGIKVELPLEASDYKELMDELIKKEEGE